VKAVLHPWKVRFLIGLCVCAPLVHALDPNKALTQDVHRIWGQEEGLFQPTIYSILQTRNGFLWLGTQDSLIRFDGSHFREYDNAAEAGLQRSLIRSLLEDKAGNLWVGSVGSGLVRIAPDGTFKRFGAAEGLATGNIFSLSSDPSGTIWICTDSGLLRFNGTRFQALTTANGLPSNQVRDTCQTSDGTRWVAGIDFGLSRFVNGRFEAYLNSAIAPHQNISALECGGDATLWVGEPTGLTRISGNSVRSYTMRDGLPDNAVSALHETSDGTLWIGTNDGITRLRNGTFSVYRTRDGLSHSLVLSLFTDREGTLWAGTKNGLDEFTEGKVTPFTTNEGMLSNSVGPVVEDNSSRLWIGTLGAGLNYFDGQHFGALTSRDGLLDNNIVSLQPDAAGDLWVGTPRGLNRLHNGKVIAGFPGPAINALFVDDQGTLWIGTAKGLDKFTNGRVQPAALLTDSSQSNPIVALGGASLIRLFVSAAGPELSSLKGDVVSTSALDISHPVDCFYIDRVNHIGWFGTAGSGLLHWKNGVYTHIRVKDGLYDNRIYAILRDNGPNLWMASSKGIFRVSQKELDDFAAGKIHYVNSIPFTTGQLRFECSSGVQPAAWQTHDGRLWFSTTNGLVVVDPKNLNSNHVAPPVAVTASLINGQRTPPQQDVHLSPFERNLEIRYAGLSFISPEKVTFRYMLEGYDKAWTDAGTRREAFYSNLPPGHFRFLVKARNADGVWSGDSAELRFYVEPRFYQRWWFFPMLAALLAASIAFWYRLRIRRLNRNFQLVLAERNRIARELHDTLLQGLSGITMQLQALWTRLAASREKEQLREIIQDAARCSTEARQSLWGLRSATTSSLEFTQKLAAVCREANAGNATGLVLHLHSVSLAAMPEAEFQLLRIAKEAISNAIRHSHATTIEVELATVQKELRLVISDDGIGFDQAKLQYGHFGLMGMRERAQEIGAQFSLTASPGDGVRVEIRLPLFAGKAESNPSSIVAHQLD
jgi:signal transduction histidine kinase/ligand-binding sensor domain-containing protein